MATTRRKNYALSPAQKSDARAALELIGDRGLTLTECVRLALQLPGSQPVAEVSVGHCIQAFLDSRQCRETTLGYYQQMLWRFEEEAGIRNTSQITTALVRAYLDGMTGTRPQMYRALSAWLRWAYRQDPPMVGDDVMRRIPRPAARSPERGFLSVDQCRRALAHPALGHSIAMGMFTGIRLAELGRMDWSHVQRDDWVVRVPAAAAKSGRARVLDTLPETVWPWIEGAPPDGPILAMTPQALSKAFVRWIPEWPANALRHTFATYHVAAYRNPGETALILGHEGNLQMLYSHYRGLATAAEAERFWAIRP